MEYIFINFFYQPILNLLVFLYNSLGDLGLAIFFLTLIIKLILYPLSRKSIKSQKALQDLQPKIEEIKERNKGNQQAMSVELMSLYKQSKVNPFSSCLPLLVQLPFFIAIFKVFQDGFAQKHLELLYPFISNPGTINTISLGFFNLDETSVVLAILAGIAQFFQAKMMLTKKPEIKAGASKDESMMAIMNKQILYVMPIVTVFIGISFPAGLAFYWLLTTVFTIIQQKITIIDKNSKKPEVIVLN